MNQQRKAADENNGNDVELRKSVFVDQIILDDVARSYGPKINSMAMDHTVRFPVDCVYDVPAFRIRFSVSKISHNIGFNRFTNLEVCAVYTLAEVCSA